MTIVILAACIFGLTHGMTQAHAETSTEYPGLDFVLINNGDEYNVRAANKQITEAAIPSLYKGLPVTEIADNGFAMCAQLRTVQIPASVKRVGNNAFMRCTNLIEVSGTSNVEDFGISAFSMCSNLDYFMFSRDVKSLGSGMLRNVNCTLYSRATEDKLSTLGTAWKTAFGGDIVYGNALVFNDYELNGEEGLSLVRYQGISAENETLVIPSFVDYAVYNNETVEINKKVLNIASEALVGCEANSIIVKHPDGTDYNHSINLDAYAFAYTYTNSISIETDITLNPTVYHTAEGVFLYSTMQSVTLPNSITEYPKYMFNGCEQLSSINNLDPTVETNHIPDKITKIGVEAFTNCYSIKKLYISETIEEIGNSAFKGWGNKPNLDENYNQYIGINIFEEETVGWALWDNEINYEHCEVDFTAASEFTVAFVAEKEGVHNVVGSDSKIVLRGNTLSSADIPVPTATSHDFNGVWYTTENRTAGTEFDFNKPIKRNYTLYAGWNVKIFEITFEDTEIVKFYKHNSDRDVLNGLSFSYEYGWQFDFVIDTKMGYENTRIYYGDTEVVKNEDGVYSLYIVRNARIESESRKTEYSIEYKNLRGGVKGANNKATYTIDDLPLRLDDPIWTQGYKTGVWEQPPVTENTLRDISVTALWSNPIVHTITYTNLRGGTKGANNKTTYTADDLIGKISLRLDNPTWTVAYGAGTWNMPVIDDNNIGSFTATAVWSNPKTFNITYTNLRGGTKGSNNKITYTADDLIGKSRLQLDNPTWTDAYGSGTWSMPVINDKNLVSFTATAVWSNPKTFNITYTNLRGGTKGANNKNTYTADDLIGKDKLYLDRPIWNVAYKDSKWNMPVINDNNIRNFTATAVWSDPEIFHITYANLDGGKKGANNKNTYTADDLIGKDRLRLDNPSWPAAFLSGTWSMPVINDNNLGGFTATAVWDGPKFYNIIYNLPTDCEFYYWCEDLEWWYSYDPLTKENLNKKTFKYLEGYVFEYVPGKKGYIGEWRINGQVVDRIPARTYDHDVIVTFTWKPITYTVEFFYQNIRGYDSAIHNYDADIAESKTVIATYDVQYMEYAKEIEGYNLYYWYINCFGSGFIPESYDSLHNPLRYENLRPYQGGYVAIVLTYDGVGGDGECIADGTLITLADGTQKAVEKLTGDEMLLAWNLKTGTFDVAPILFIDHDPAKITEIINLRFSDNTEVKVIYEHGFWDFDLNRYVYMTTADAAQYIGHWFNKQTVDENGNMTWTKVQLVDVEITEEYTSAWSPVTYGHLCYYVNGMLSMPGGIEGMFNIFEVGEDMKYDAEAMEKDIQTYGLFTYEEFAELVPVPEEMFNAVSGQYLKVAIGKGLITVERLQQLVDRYGVFFE